MTTDAQMDVDNTTPSPLSGRSGPEEAGPSVPSGSTSTSAGPGCTTGSGTSRLEKVSAKDLCDFKGELQLVAVMRDAIKAHQSLHEGAGVLHGDINPNTIVILETEDGKVEGALIDYDVPLCRAAMRKLEKPDPVVPPPQRARQVYTPRYYW